MRVLSPKCCLIEGEWMGTFQSEIPIDFVVFAHVSLIVSNYSIAYLGKHVPGDDHYWKSHYQYYFWRF